jgi:hypothetical protein
MIKIMVEELVGVGGAPERAEYLLSRMEKEGILPPFVPTPRGEGDYYCQVHKGCLQAGYCGWENESLEGSQKDHSSVWDGPKKEFK